MTGPSACGTSAPASPACCPRKSRPATLVPPPANAAPAFGAKGPGAANENWLDDLGSGYDFGIFSPDTRLLARFDHGAVALRDSASGAEVLKFPELHRIEPLAFSND